ncbi:MAG TPA: helix-turn-helix domain-containing protein [Gaiellaceae bacterium]|nr:helix-turn-helix domain-containing protein [Gaiellaceae bacterium]
MTEPAFINQSDLLEPTHIGPRLRAQREQLGLSLREIARRIGVSASLISQIERDKVNPSVSTLWALVRELQMTMGDLFAVGDAPVAVASPVSPNGSGFVVPADRRAVINLDSGVIWERLTSASDPSVEFLRLTYQVGSESCPEDSLMRHSGKEYGYILSGSLGVQIGFDRFELGPGDAISFDGSAPHRLWAIGDRPAEAIWAVVGRQGEGRG